MKCLKIMSSLTAKTGLVPGLVSLVRTHDIIFLVLPGLDQISLGCYQALTVKARTATLKC